MSVNERGDYVNTATDEWAKRVFTNTDEGGRWFSGGAVTGQGVLVPGRIEPKTLIEQGYIMRWPI